MPLCSPGARSAPGEVEKSLTEGRNGPRRAGSVNLESGQCKGAPGMRKQKEKAVVFAEKKTVWGQRSGKIRHEVSFWRAASARVWLR